MPKRAAASTFVVAATKWSSTGPPPPARNHAFAVSRWPWSWVVKVFAGDDEERLGRPHAAEDGGDVVAVDVGNEVEFELRVGEGGERADRHLRPEVAAADADVDDVAKLAGVGARTDRVGKNEHRG